MFKWVYRRKGVWRRRGKSWQQHDCSISGIRGTQSERSARSYMLILCFSTQNYQMKMEGGGFRALSSSQIDFIRQGGSKCHVLAPGEVLIIPNESERTGKQPKADAPST